MSHQAIHVSYAWTRKQPTPLCPVDINACALTAQFWWTSARCVVWQNSASSKYLDDCCFFDIAHYLSHTTSLDHAGTCPVCPCRISLLLPHQFNLIVCGLDDKIVRASTRMRKENAKIAWQCNRTAKPKRPHERCGFQDAVRARATSSARGRRARGVSGGWAGEAGMAWHGDADGGCGEAHGVSARGEAIVGSETSSLREPRAARAQAQTIGASVALAVHL